MNNFGRLLLYIFTKHHVIIRSFMLITCFPPTSGFTGFSISCSSVILTVEHDDRRPRDEASPVVPAGTAPSQDEAADLLGLLLNGDTVAVDSSELTDRTALRCSVSSSGFLLVL